MLISISDVLTAVCYQIHQCYFDLFFPVYGLLWNGLTNLLSSHYNHQEVFHFYGHWMLSQLIVSNNNQFQCWLLLLQHKSLIKLITVDCAFIIKLTKRKQVIFFMKVVYILFSLLLYIHLWQPRFSVGLHLRTLLLTSFYRANEEISDNKHNFIYSFILF